MEQQRSDPFVSKIIGGRSNSLRLPRSDSYLSNKVAGRSKSSRLFLESVPAKCAAVTIYERLYSDDEPQPQRKAGVWRFLRRAFSGNDGEGRKVAKEAVAAAADKRRRSSWLPDPHKRWPLQGW